MPVQRVRSADKPDDPGADEPAVRKIDPADPILEGLLGRIDRLEHDNRSLQGQVRRARRGSHPDDEMWHCGCGEQLLIRERDTGAVRFAHKQFDILISGAAARVTFKCPCCRRTNELTLEE